MNVIPHVTRRRGDVRLSSSGKEVISKFGIWTWKSEDLLQSLEINEHINKLQITFASVYTVLCNLPQAENTWIDICIMKGGAGKSDEAAEFLLDTKSIAILRDFGIPVEFTVY